MISRSSDTIKLAQKQEICRDEISHRLKSDSAVQNRSGVEIDPLYLCAYLHNARCSTRIHDLFCFWWENETIDRFLRDSIIIRIGAIHKIRSFLGGIFF